MVVASRTAARGIRFADWFRPASAFVVNGALYGSLLTRYPEIADRVAASGSEFGVVLFAAAAGGLLGSLAAPALARVVRESSALLVAGTGYALFAVAVALAPDLYLLGCGLLLQGLFDGMHDVTMNAATVRVQQDANSKLMGRMHATWSLSLAGAGLLGAVAVGMRIPVAWHIGLVAGIALVVQTAAAVWRPRSETKPGEARTPAATRSGSRPSLPAQRGRTVRLRHVLPVLGVAALAASYVESPGQEWTGLLLSRGLDAEPQLAASAPVLFGAGLVVSRLVLDAAQQLLGSRVVAVGSGLTMVLAMLAGCFIIVGEAAPGWALVAVTAAGIGAGPVFPLLFGAGEHLSVRHGIPVARTASIVSALSRVGAISAPVVVGPLTEAFGMVTVFAVMAAGALLVLFALPRVVR
ncbi:MFS transporter [Catellatospora sichuanensis]|uniref:MFS transporter n=1 Tax=Catellatospora sichuanensis TaxID=1969805 RepID=UPI001FEA8230|nr:MFS transporter [Catellatospora sichuanensis]